jgi:serine/threonine-protein kinase
MGDARDAAGSAAERDLVGRQLGDFRLLRRLGRGAMAEVYLAEQVSLGRQIAIKVLKGQLAADETYVRRFHNEARAAAALVHPNIVQIHEVGCVDGIHYIAQEYVQGLSLQQLIDRGRLPELPQAVSIMRQVACALAKAAERGIVHRDIKPANILLARDGLVKVADFGLARISGDAANQLTQAGITLGTPLYMSPEQAEGKPLDCRSDLYSLGVTCYHMLSGRPPFQGETPLAVAMQHVRHTAERLENLRPDLPAALCRIVHRLLEKEPKDRYPRPQDLLRELRALAIPGLETDWQADWPEIAGDDSPLATHAATGRLQSLMLRSLEARQRTRRTRLGLGLALLSAPLAGAAVAWFGREPFLLADRQPVEIPRQRSAEEQLMWAKLVRSEEALRAVEMYFPGDSYHIRRAHQDLARLYLAQDRLDEAMLLLDELARLDTDPEFRAFGLAGQAFVHARRREHDQALKALADLQPLALRLDGQMSSLVRATLEQLRRHMDEQTEAAWDQLLKSLPGEPDEEEAPENGTPD